MSRASGTVNGVPYGAAIGRLGGAFMISRYTKALADKHGFEGAWVSYFAGRAGVFGPTTSPDVVTAGLFFFAADAVRDRWQTARDTVDVEAYAQDWLGACHTWGREKLDGVEGLDRLADLAFTVVREADVAGAPLFAAWRDQPLPPAGDDAALAAHACFLLREHRGAMHNAAVLTGGLTPLQAILSGPGGESNADTFGWTPPFEDPAPYAAARAAVEAVTDEAAARPYAVLDDAEQAELGERLEMAVEHLAPRATLDGR